MLRAIFNWFFINQRFTLKKAFFRNSGLICVAHAIKGSRISFLWNCSYVNLYKKVVPELCSMLLHNYRANETCCINELSFDGNYLFFFFFKFHYFFSSNSTLNWPSLNMLNLNIWTNKIFETLTKLSCN